MSRSSEVAPAGVAREPGPPRLCAYCGGPLRETSSPVASAYCCYGCRVLGEAGRRPPSALQEQGSPWFKIAVGAVLAGQAMLLGLAVNLTPPSGPARGLLHAALIISSLSALALLGPPLVTSALEEVRRRRVSIELMFLAGIVGALGASIHSTLTGVGAVYYEVVAVLLTVYAVGKTLGAESRARAFRETRHLAQAFETCRKVRPDGLEHMVKVATIHKGDRVRVLSGEAIPIDGEILRGQAFICETPLTGEPFPVVRRPGDSVCAGSYSEDGELCIQATAEGTARRLDGLLAALESARERPSRWQAQADRIVGWFLPLVLTLSLGTFIFWTVRSGWAVGLFNGLAVLLVACPCAMGLATPVALWNGLAALATRGFVVQSADVLERLAGLDRVVFDKTGTLSEEKFSLIDLATAGSVAERRALTAQIVVVQRASTHPVARAFQSLAVEGGLEPNASEGSATLERDRYRVRSLKTIPGLGVEAWLESVPGDEYHLRIGRRELLTSFSGEPALKQMLRPAPLDHLIYVQVDGRLQAIVAVRERLRRSAAEALDGLARLGIGCAVLTGDRAEQVAALLPVADFEGSLTPQAKAHRVEAIGRTGLKVGFVGDGVNDAPSMRQASVGVALAHGAGVTVAHADAVLYGGDLRVVPWAIAVCRRVRDSVRSNLVFAAAYNTLGMILAAAGLLHPVAAALLMVVSSFTVCWRALRSAEDDDGCCAPPAPESGCSGGLRLPLDSSDGHRPPLQEASREARLSEGRVVRGPDFWSLQFWCGLLLAAQAPFLVYLGRLDTASSLGLSALLLAGGVGAARFRSRNPEWRRLVVMAFAMLGLGNWGMILGWWADAGFKPAPLGCLHCVSGGFSLDSLIRMPWMNLGMLLFGLPPMLLGSANPRPGLGRFAFGLLSALGMVWGMNFGNDVAVKWLGSLVAPSFLLSFLGMTVGMLLGMFLFCEFGRALSSARPGRNRQPTRGNEAAKPPVKS